MILFKLIAIATIVIFIIDLSGFVMSVKKGLFKLVFGKKEFQEYRIKPFDCSLCMTFWICTGYLFYTGNISIPNMLAVSMISFYSENIMHFLIAVKDIIGNFTNKITDYYGIDE